MGKQEDILNLEDPSHINPATEPVVPQELTTQKNNIAGGKKIPKKMLIMGIVVILVLATIGTALYFMTSRVNKDDVEFQISGPESVKSGEEVVLKIGYANNNSRVTMQDTQLVLTVPKGFEFVSSSLSPTDSKNLTWNLGEVSSKTQQIIEVRAKFYGDIDSTVPVSGSLSFTPNSVTQKITDDAKYSPAIISPKVALDLNAPDTLDAGGKVTYQLDIVNNESSNYENASIKFSLPKGFTTLPAPEGTTTQDAPKYDKNSDTWKLGILTPSQKKTITLSGRLDGANGEQQDIGAQLLLTKDDVNYIQEQVSKVTVISSPSILITEQSSVSVANAGDEVRFLLTIKNTGNFPLTNLALSVALTSQVVNPSSLRIDSGGTFKDSVVSWDNTVVNSLKLLNPNQEFKIGFSVSSYKDITTTGKEFSIVATPKITTGVQEVPGDAITVKVKTALDVSSKASPFDSDGNPIGTGPTTPTVGKTTVYRISFTMTNKYNTLDNAKLVCNVPLGATYTGTPKTSPGTLVFDSTLKNVVWTIGTLRAKTEGSGTAIATGYFDVSVTPSEPNKKQAMTLAKDCVMSAHDSFVNQDISVTFKNFVTERVQ